MIFQSGCNTHKQWMRVPVFPRPCQCFLLFVFFHSSYFSGCETIVHDILNLHFPNVMWILYLLAVHISFSVNCLQKFFANIFLTELFCLHIIEEELLSLLLFCFVLCSLETSLLLRMWNVFSQSVPCLHFLNGTIWGTKVLHFWWGPIYPSL